MKIEDQKCCPHCGGNSGYYSRYSVKGTFTEFKRWDGKETSNEPDLIYVPLSKYYYCWECDKKVCKK